MSSAILEQPQSPPVGDDELYEVIDGIRVRTPPMAVYSVWIANRLVRFLANFAEERLGWAITEALFHLPAPINRDRRPDIAFVSYQRWPKEKPMPPTDDAWDVVPNLVVEVVSPSDNINELEQKIVEYFRVGVQLVWVVHPTGNKIHVYQSPTQISGLAKHETLDGGSVVPGFRLPLSELFTQSIEPTGMPNGSK